ncbi:MAG TPA: uracil-DNA glycosylase family protein [Candidatus Binatia bacterium]|nr:uracil-DNA glycosylase family protein [Candidatus Binatia bacterium]
MDREARAAALRALQRDHRACARCVDAGLLGSAHPVFSGGLGQRIMLVGQAPGPVEVGAERPFAGRAGRQLMRWFQRAGFAGEDDVRRRVYMTSMTTCFPGRNRDGRGDRRPGPREVALCSPWLQGAIALVRPRLLLPVGSLALARFLPRHSLDSAVGRLFASSGVEVVELGRPPLVLPLPHPSGQSRWLNDPARMARLEQSLARLPELVRWAEAR